LIENNFTPPNEMPQAPIHRVLVGQKALVTGASKGLGQAMAIGFARAGADVLVNYSTDEAGARHTARVIEQNGGRAIICKANVSKEEVAHLRIRVNSVSPGAIRTPMNVEKLTSQEMYERVLLKLIPSKRIGEPDDVARTAVWLASDESDYLQGTTIYIDGGMTLYPGFIGAG
jgi:NAD(P)-dependent dehydrogenase (short-subunit alcohol dehydrogenase family)